MVTISFTNKEVEDLQSFLCMARNRLRSRNKKGFLDQSAMDGLLNRAFALTIKIEEEVKSQAKPQERWTSEQYNK